VSVKRQISASVSTKVDALIDVKILLQDVEFGLKRFQNTSLPASTNKLDVSPGKAKRKEEANSYAFGSSTDGSDRRRGVALVGE
jgi:hypothetical protein